MRYLITGGGRELSKKLRIELVRSVIGRHYTQKRTVKALGFKKLHQIVVHPDNPQIRGMVNKVKHLLRVEEFNGD